MASDFWAYVNGETLVTDSGLKAKPNLSLIQGNIEKIRNIYAQILYLDNRLSDEQSGITEGG